MQLPTNNFRMVRVYDNIIPDGVCSDLIELFENSSQQQEYVNNNSTPCFTQLNINQYYSKSLLIWLELSLISLLISLEASLTSLIILPIPFANSGILSAPKNMSINIIMTNISTAPINNNIKQK